MTEQEGIEVPRAAIERWQVEGRGEASGLPASLLHTVGGHSRYVSCGGGSPERRAPVWSKTRVRWSCSGANDGAQSTLPSPPSATQVEEGADGLDGWRRCLLLLTGPTVAFSLPIMTSHPHHRILIILLPLFRRRQRRRHPGPRLYRIPANLHENSGRMLWTLEPTKPEARLVAAAITGDLVSLFACRLTTPFIRMDSMALNPRRR
ncbi:unnamed protein product [Schistocephalus solidus]|uniref:Uncharacterized protein n=1 Tax=Schistocephalus solidus TaxID=70667 RepID=A0A183TRY0_SCHSO|nr:unnamed protein product [Schistocephalus solidus]